MPTSTSLEQIQALYVAYYGRPGDPGGLDYWATRLDANGGDLKAMTNAFGQSQEYLARFGGMDDAQRIETLYGQLFGRAADDEGRDYYVGVLARGEKSLAEIALTVANAAQGGDRAVLDARVAAADEFTATLSTPEAVAAYSTASGLAGAQAQLAAITAESLPSPGVSVPGPADGIDGLPGFPEASGQAVTLDAGGWLRLENGADISEMSLAGVNYLSIADAASVAMTPDQLAVFESIGAGRSGTPGHETIFFTQGGTVDLTDDDVSYNYVEEYRLSDAGNTVIAGSGGYWIVGGAGDDTMTAGAGEDSFTYVVGSGGADTLIDFDVIGGRADELNFINVADADALAASVVSLRFIDNGSEVAGEPGIDLEIAFTTGGSLTLTDQYAVGLDLVDLGLRSASGETLVPADGSIEATGVTGGELSALFGESLWIGY